MFILSTYCVRFKQSHRASYAQPHLMSTEEVYTLINIIRDNGAAWILPEHTLPVALNRIDSRYCGELRWIPLPSAVPSGFIIRRGATNKTELINTATSMAYHQFERFIIMTVFMTQRSSWKRSPSQLHNIVISKCTARDR